MEEEKEEWIPIEFTKGKYHVSNLGRIKRVFGIQRKSNILSGSIDKNGYLRVFFKGFSGRHSIARLVGIAFISNENCKPQIDHIDTVRTNNKASNLRWATPLENSNNPITLLKRVGLNSGSSSVWFGVRNGASPNSYPIDQYDKKSNFIKSWDSTIRVERELGFSHQSVGKCVLGKTKSAYGFIWTVAWKCPNSTYHSNTGKFTDLSKPVVCLDINGVFLNEYPSAKYAEIDGYDASAIGRCCRGENKLHKKLKWMYKKQYLSII